jgi:mRNA interferase MazF
MHINVVPFTSQKRKILPIHVVIEGFGLSMRSVALTELVTSVDKSRVLKKIGSIAGTEKMAMIERCLCNQFGVA